MQGKVVVITGGTSGIGQVSAEKLAAMGARIVLVLRCSKSRGEATLAPIAGNRSGAGLTAFITAMFRGWLICIGWLRSSGPPSRASTC